MTAKVLIIGLDAVDKDLLLRWADDGSLPTFASLLPKAAWGDVRNPLSFEAGSAWPCFCYGSLPSVHGQYDGHRYFSAETYRFQAYADHERTSQPIWARLSEAGKSCLVIDAPYMAVPTQANCTAIMNWGSHTPIAGCARIDPVTNPPDLRAEIVARFGTDPLGGYMCDHYRPRTASDMIWFRDALLARIRQRASMTSHFLSRQPWDLALAVFSEGHCIGHHGWHLHDSSHPEHDPALARQLGDPIRDVYRGLDAAIAGILAACGPETTTIIYLSHGMGAGYSGTRLLDCILARLDSGGAESDGEASRRALRSLGARVWRASPKAGKHLLNPLRKWARKSVYHDGFQPNRQGRRYFEVYGNDRSAGIRINLVGREKHGLVRPGAEYDQLCDQLGRDLLEIRNAETGAPLVAEVVRTDQVYSGKNLDKLPDLMVTWNREAPINVVTSEKIGRIAHPHPNIRSGDHKPDGLFLASGPGVRPGRLNRDVGVVDFAPTVAALLDARTDGFDGTPVDAIRAGLPQETRGKASPAGALSPADSRP